MNHSLRLCESDRGNWWHAHNAGSIPLRERPSKSWCRARCVVCPVWLHPSPNVHFRCTVILTPKPGLLKCGWSGNVFYHQTADRGWGLATSPTELHSSTAQTLGSASTGQRPDYHEHEAKVAITLRRHSPAYKIPCMPTQLPTSGPLEHLPSATGTCLNSFLPSRLPSSPMT
jgi:hypothetical protein